MTALDRRRFLELGVAAALAPRARAATPLRVVVAGESLLVLNGDGVVNASPTGSTAYTVGAGGPAVAPTATAVEEYPVQITFPAAGLSVTVQDGNLQPIMTANPANQVWSIKLRRGLYRVVVAGGSEKTFSVTGPGSDAAGIVHVAA